MKRGTVIRKREGYEFHGVVLETFQKIDGGTLIAVECLSEGARGMTHLFRTPQLVAIGEMNIDEDPMAAKVRSAVQGG